jgi:hypothetical protein
MSRLEEKKLILLTELPGGKRLAALRGVERFDGGQVVLETDQGDRSDSIPAENCIEVKGGEDVAAGGLGLGVRRIDVASLTGADPEAGEDAEGGDHGALEAFSLETGAPVYVVRGPSKERRNALADRLREAVGPEPIVVACPETYSVRRLDTEQMEACGWVRVDDSDSSSSSQPPEADDA